MLSSGAYVIIWDELLSSGMKCYHLGWNVIIWDAMLSSGANVIIWDKMLSCGANVVMLSFGAIVIIWCYHVMLSSGMITSPYFIFPENFTHSKNSPKFLYWFLSPVKHGPTRNSRTFLNTIFLSVCNVHCSKTLHLSQYFALICFAILFFNIIPFLFSYNQCLFFTLFLFFYLLYLTVFLTRV